jgi:thiol-disulfide isomerase/thioredoxin
MRKLLLCLFFCLFSVTSFAFETVNDYDIAINLAKTQQKNVLVIFGLENCHYCKVLKKDLVALKNIDNYIVCYLDSRENKKLTGKMGIKKWPTSVVVTVGSENQGESARVVGYGNKKEYDDWLKLNAAVFGDDNACGCGCSDDCPCRKNGICTCCGEKCNCKK